MKYISNDIREVILELQSRLGEDIVFTGSVEDIAHTGKALHQVNDLDILITHEQLEKAKQFYDITPFGPSYYNWFLEKEDKIRFDTVINNIKIDLFIYPDKLRRDKLYKFNAEGLEVYTRGVDFKLNAIDTMLKNAESIELEWFLHKFNEIKKLYDNANTTYLDFSG